MLSNCLKCRKNTENSKVVKVLLKNNVYTKPCGFWQ